MLDFYYRYRELLFREECLVLTPMTALTEIEKERARISETKRALDEQVQRKRDLLAQRDAQERAYYQQQEVSKFFR